MPEWFGCRKNACKRPPFVQSLPDCAPVPFPPAAAPPGKLHFGKKERLQGFALQPFV